MDGARLSRFPHLSWLGYGFESPARAESCCWNLNGAAHSLHMVFSGPHDVHWISRGQQTHYGVRNGSFHYLPADEEQHTIVANPSGPIRSHTFFIPPHHINDIASADHLENRIEFSRLLLHEDATLQACMTRLATPASDSTAPEECWKDEAARRLVLRLIQVSGGGTPDWQTDGSIFGNRTMQMLVDSIDAQLQQPPHLLEMAMLTGLSPSHFATKFRRSTGLSLYRFINRRRVMKSLSLLKNGSTTLVELALDLGFSSQSHFTRIFSEVTCMTPAKFRSQFRRTVG